MSDVQLTCDAGYVFTDGVAAYTITCLLDGQWNSEIPDCIGTLCHTAKEDTF